MKIKSSHASSSSSLSDERKSPCLVHTKSLRFEERKKEVEEGPTVGGEGMKRNNKTVSE